MNLSRPTVMTLYDQVLRLRLNWALQIRIFCAGTVEPCTCIRACAGADVLCSLYTQSRRHTVTVSQMQCKQRIAVLQVVSTGQLTGNICIT
jgi:hypothetical protein